MEFKLKKDSIIYAITALFTALVYSYKDAVWVNEKYAMYFERGDTTTPIYLLLAHSALLIVFIVGVKKICKNKKYFLYGFLFFLTISFYFAKSFLEDGVYSALTSPTTPIVYLLSLAFFVGMDDKIWNAVRKCLPVLIVAYICLLIYSYMSLLNRYGAVVVGNSSLIFYYVALFWCSIIYLTDRILQKEDIGLFQQLLIAFNIVFAVIINSRSWTIQSCLVAIVVYLFGTTQHSIRAKVLRILLLITAGFLILQLLDNYFSTSLDFFIEKIGRDSRSHQYADIASASSLEGWIFGNGAQAVYYESAQGFIANIDNQYIFIAFHYGVVVLLQWLAPQVMALFSIVKNRKIRLIAALPIICWFMALGGLSIFNGVYCDLKNLMIMLYMGHVMSLNNNGGYADE
jgi:hypothetical protein